MLDITQDEIEATTKQYGGTFTVMKTLDIGIKFNVCNGHWDGEIVEKENEKWILIKGNKEPSIRLNNDYYLWIDIIEYFEDDI